MSERISAFSLRKFFRLDREKLLAHRNDLAASHLSSGPLQQPIARVRFACAAVPHRRQVLHFLGILLANVAQVQR